MKKYFIFLFLLFIFSCTNIHVNRMVTHNNVQVIQFSKENKEYINKLSHIGKMSSKYVEKVISNKIVDLVKKYDFDLAKTNKLLITLIQVYSPGARNYSFKQTVDSVFEAMGSVK